jgi:hypothetical protein
MKKPKAHEIPVHLCDIVFELLDNLCGGGRLISERDAKRVILLALQQLANLGYRLEGMGGNYEG